MLYIGVMSGTSCDGVDVALVEINGGIKVTATNFAPFPKDIQLMLSRLIADEPTKISEICRLDVELAHQYAQAISGLMASQGLDANSIQAIGLHGQTIWHAPDDKPPNTLQLGAAAVVAQKTGIKTVANFRQLDVAYGGQGAPLAPVLHQQLFQQPQATVAVINLGGIANVTWLNDDQVFGFDVGPASCLMDAWIMHQQAKAYDHNGQWAAQGTVIKPLLQKLLNEPFLQQQGPKSTGRELFNLGWLKNHLAAEEAYQPVDVQRTLLQFTVEAIRMHIEQVGLELDHVVICGGGVHNQFLMKELQTSLCVPCRSSAEDGIDPDYVEACLMAWLAAQNSQAQKLNLTEITGCSQAIRYGVCFNPD